MEAYAKDYHCLKLANYLQNLYLLSHTFVAVIYIA